MTNNKELSDEHRKILEDIALAIQRKDPPTKLRELVKDKPKRIPKSIFYKNMDVSPFSRTDIGEECPYDLMEVGRALDVEPFIANSVRKHRELILKRGVFIKSEDEELTDYLNNRMFELSLRSPQIFMETVREAITNLIKYHTAFIVMDRDSELSTGRRIKVHGKKLDPISSIYSVDPCFMRPVLSKNKKRIIKWVLISNQSDGTVFGGEKAKIVGEWPDHDVVCITMDRKSGFIYGTPYIIPVLDDIRALRKLEELSLIIPSKNTFNTIHVKVGTEERPAEQFEDGTREVDLVSGEMEQLSEDAAIVTNERVTIEPIQAIKDPVDLQPYLEYFQKRVLSGLRLADIDIGRGDSVNKSTAGSLSKAMEDACADYQKVFCDQLSWKLLLYLSMEGGFNVNPTNFSCFEFPEVNMESERANQNHGMTLAQSDLISESEYRKNYLGKKPMSETERKDTIGERVFQKEMQVAAKAQAAKNAAKNKSQPRNQSGKKSTKTRVTANNSLSEDLLSIEKSLLSCRDNYKIINWNEMSNALYTKIKSLINPIVIKNIINGSNDACAQLNKEPIAISQKIYDQFDKYLYKLLTEKGLYALIQLSSETEASSVDTAIKAFVKNVNDSVEELKITSYRLGFIKAARTYQSAEIQYIKDDIVVANMVYDQKTIPIATLSNISADKLKIKI